MTAAFQRAVPGRKRWVCRREHICWKPILKGDGTDGTRVVRQAESNENKLLADAERSNVRCRQGAALPAEPRLTATVWDRTAVAALRGVLGSPPRAGAADPNVIPQRPAGRRGQEEKRVTDQMAPAPKALGLLLGWN